MPLVGSEPTIVSIRASEDSSCLRLRGHCDRLFEVVTWRLPGGAEETHENPRNIRFPGPTFEPGTFQT
jgi:hypothetical protein